jgi:hypothetical protein
MGPLHTAGLSPTCLQTGGFVSELCGPAFWIQTLTNIGICIETYLRPAQTRSDTKSVARRQGADTGGG